MSRRGAGEGSVRHRKDGRWEARIWIDDASGRPRRHTKTARTQAAAIAWLNDARRLRASGLALATEQRTLAAHLEAWLRDTVRPSRRPSTYRSYEGIVRVHLVPGLGGHRLTALTPQHVQAFLNAKAASGLSPQTVTYIRGVLRAALHKAEQAGLVTRNVAKLADPPSVPRRRVQPFSPDEARAFLRAIEGDRLEALFSLAIATGLRQGELLGLSWSHVDLEAGTVRVERALQRVDGRLALVEPKSDTSHRTVPIPAFALACLGRHRTRQLQERLLAGSRWVTDERDLVFRTTIGTAMDGGSVTHRLQELLERVGLPRQRFHDLRHACATLLLARNVAPRVVMEILGHSQIGLTMNTYAHVIAALPRAAADELDYLLGQAPVSSESA